VIVDPSVAFLVSAALPTVFAGQCHTNQQWSAAARPEIPFRLRNRRGRALEIAARRGPGCRAGLTLGRIKALVIPLASEDVWICVDPRGHIQATGTDVAGRRQYRYHDQWREVAQQFVDAGFGYLVTVNAGPAPGSDPIRRCLR
jgi:hypothetical protein